MKKSYFYGVFTAVALLSVNTFAADAPKNMDAAKAADAAKKVTFPEKDYKVAYQLLEAQQLQQTLNTQIDQIVDSYVKMIQDGEAVRQPMIDFFRKYWNMDNLKEKFAAIYLENFTPAELEELTKFYQSPIGKKFLAKNATLTIEGAKIVQQAFVGHEAELQEILAKAMDQEPVDVEESEMVMVEEAVPTTSSSQAAPAKK